MKYTTQVDDVTLSDMPSSQQFTAQGLDLTLPNPPNQTGKDDTVQDCEDPKVSKPSPMKIRHKITIICILTVVAGILIFGLYEYLNWKKSHSQILSTNPTSTDFTSKNVTSSDITSKNDTDPKPTSENPSEHENNSKDDKTKDTESTNDTPTDPKPKDETPSNTTVSDPEPKDNTSSEDTAEDSTLIESPPTKFAVCQASLLGLTDEPLTSSSLNIDARNTILQRILCSSNNKSFCTIKYPAEVVKDLATVTIIYTPSSPSRIPLLYKYTEDFQSYVQSFGMSTCLLESIMDGQSFALTKPQSEPSFIQVKNNQHFFKRENLLNVAIKKLLKQTEWQIFAWIDAHQVFSNNYWWEETILKASRGGVVQLFQTEVYSNPWNVTTTFSGLGAVYELGLVQKTDQKLGIPFFGNAWAISRDLYKKIEYIYDQGVGGSTDYIFSTCARNNGLLNWPEFEGDTYYKLAIPWMKKVVPIFNDAATSIRGNLRHFEHERTFYYGAAIDYIKANYAHTSFLTRLHREEDFSLIVDDPNFANFESRW